jgi:hypothetical protein
MRYIFTPMCSTDAQTLRYGQHIRHMTVTTRYRFITNHERNTKSRASIRRL